MKFILFIYILTFSFSFAQTTSPLLPSEQFPRFHKLTVDDGLSQNGLGFINQDHQGFIWFGSAGGLDRFDGIEFKTFRNIPGLKKQPVYFISSIENPDSTFWISTELGLVLFNPRTASAQMFTPPVPLIFGGGTDNIHHLTRLNDNTLLLEVAGKGILQFDTHSKKFLLVYSFKSLMGHIQKEDAAGIIPFKNNTALIITNTEILFYDFNTQNLKTISNFSNNILAKCAWYDKDKQTVLIGTTNGVFEFKNNTLKSAVLPVLSGIQPGISVHAIYQDTKSTLWIGTENGAIAINEMQKSAIYYFNNPLDPESIQQGPVLIFFEDRSENLWISILDRGVCRIDLKKRKFFPIKNHFGSPKQLLSELVRDINIDHNDNIWIAGGGVTYIDPFKKKIIFHSSVPANLSTSYAFDTRKIYSLNDSLLCIIANRKVYLYNTRTSDANVLKINGSVVKDVYRAFVRNKTGNLICVTQDSIFEIDPIRARYIRSLLKFSESSLLPSIAVIDDIIEDIKGNVWIGTSNGLLYWDELQKSINRISGANENSAKLQDLTITSLAFSGNEVLWIGTTTGLYKYNLGNKEIKEYQVKDGLPNDKIWSIAVDKKERVWATSNRGLIKLQEFPDDKFTIRAYTIDDGLPSNEFNMAVVAADSKGTLYFGTPNGVVFFHPDSVEDNQNSAPIVLTDLKYYGVSDSTGSAISYATALSIPYEIKVFSIRYASLDFTDPSRNRYAYKLEGYDNRWIEAGKRREAFYTNLDPGKYTLFIKATNSDGAWNEKPLAVVIEIIPPFWMTWWFRGILFFGVILVIGGFVRYIEMNKIKQKIKKLEEKQAIEKERIRIARDMHDEIGANLTRISLLSQVDTSKMNEANKTFSLGQITNSVNETIEKLDEIVWAVNPSNDNLKNLAGYISEYAENFFEASDIKCRFNFPEIIPEINLSSEKRHHLFLVVKEALNNAQKYSEAKRVTISLMVESSFFKFLIKDEGNGFCPEAVSSTSNGIKNMRERVITIGGEFEIFSNPGKGTEVIIKVIN